MPFKIIQGANKLALISFKSFEEFVELIFCFYPDANNRPLPDFFSHWANQVVFFYCLYFCIVSPVASCSQAILDRTYDEDNATQAE